MPSPVKPAPLPGHPRCRPPSPWQPLTYVYGVTCSPHACTRTHTVQGPETHGQALSKATLLKWGHPHVPTADDDTVTLDVCADSSCSPWSPSAMTARSRSSSADQSVHGVAARAASVPSRSPASVTGFLRATASVKAPQVEVKGCYVGRTCGNL